MALIGQTLPSLLDVYSRTDKNGRIAKIVEQLAKSNDVITDAIYVPCNDGSKHKTTIRAGIPSRCGAVTTRACSLPKPRPSR